MERLVKAAELLPIFGLPITLTLQIAEEEYELEALDESLEKLSTRYRIKLCAEKTKLMTLMFLCSPV